MYRYEFGNIQVSQYNVTEPITLAEAKGHMNVTHGEDDNLITSFINYSRQIIENATHTSLIEKEIIVEFIPNQRCISSKNNSALRLRELPYGPIQSIDDVIVENGVSLDEDGYEQKGVEGGFLRFGDDFSRPVQVTYTAGYETVPPTLKLAILNQLAYLYENRGELNTMTGISPSAKALASSFKPMA